MFVYKRNNFLFDVFFLDGWERQALVHIRNGRAEQVEGTVPVSNQTLKLLAKKVDHRKKRQYLEY